jgi:hypothetical protein
MRVGEYGTCAWKMLRPCAYGTRHATIAYSNNREKTDGTGLRPAGGGKNAASLPAESVPVDWKAQRGVAAGVSFQSGKPGTAAGIFPGAGQRKPRGHPRRKRTRSTAADASRRKNPGTSGGYPRNCERQRWTSLGGSPRLHRLAIDEVAQPILSLLCWGADLCTVRGEGVSVHQQRLPYAAGTSQKPATDGGCFPKCAGALAKMPATQRHTSATAGGRLPVKSPSVLASTPHCAAPERTPSGFKGTPTAWHRSSCARDTCGSVCRTVEFQAGNRGGCLPG